MKPTKSKPVRLVRVPEGGRERVYPGPIASVRECGQLVAFWAYDNLRIPRSAATSLGMDAEKAFMLDGSFSAHGTTFTITPWTEED